MTLAPRPMRGKDIPLKALEMALEDAKAYVSHAESERRAAHYRAQEADKALALARRDVADLNRAIQVVRDMPTEPLSNYQRAVKTEEVTP